MSGTLGLKPGMYGASERWLSDSDVNDIVGHLRSVEEIWNRFSKISADDRLGDEFADELMQAINDYIVARKWVASSGDALAVLQTMREMAEEGRKSHREC